jgi:hypothetical protein
MHGPDCTDMVGYMWPGGAVEMNHTRPCWLVTWFLLTAAHVFTSLQNSEPERASWITY